MGPTLNEGEGPERSGRGARGKVQEGEGRGEDRGKGSPWTGNQCVDSACVCMCVCVCVCVCAEQRHKAALTPDILSCIEDCVVVSNKVMDDVHSNIWSDYFCY